MEDLHVQQTYVYTTPMYLQLLKDWKCTEKRQRGIRSIRVRGTSRVQTPHSCWQTARAHMSYVLALIRSTIHNSPFASPEHRWGKSHCSRCLSLSLCPVYPGRARLGMHTLSICVSDSDILPLIFIDVSSALLLWVYVSWALVTPLWFRIMPGPRDILDWW